MKKNKKILLILFVCLLFSFNVRKSLASGFDIKNNELFKDSFETNSQISEKQVSEDTYNYDDYLNEQSYEVKTYNISIDSSDPLRTFQNIMELAKKNNTYVQGVQQYRDDNGADHIEFNINIDPNNTNYLIDDITKAQIEEVKTNYTISNSSEYKNSEEMNDTYKIKDSIYVSIKSANVLLKPVSNAKLFVFIITGITIILIALIMLWFYKKDRIREEEIFN